MTTAARPTFEPARGGSSRGEKDLSAISKQYSSRDMPAHTRLKQRETGQGTVDELQSRNFRRELEERERTARSSDSRRHATSSSSGASRRETSSAAAPPSTAALDADDPADADDSGDSDDSEDDEAELLAELQRIRKERAVETVKRDADRRAEQERIRTENILSGNPLLSYAAGGGARQEAAVKRRWDDDVVFKNCARVDPERKEARFINDAIRNDFHRKFMDKYIK